MSALPKQPEQADGIADLRSVDLSATITFSKAPNKESMSWETVPTPLGALLTNLKNIQVGKKGDGNAWAPATFKDGRRKAEYALKTHLLVLDSDAGHLLATLRTRFEALGWYVVIIPSPSWGSDVSKIREDAFNRWADELRQAEGETADTPPERFLIERHNKTPAVAEGAEIIDRETVEETDKQGRKRIISWLHIRHRPCEKYRIICVLSEPFGLSTKEEKRAWKIHYDAVVDLVELPLDRTCSSPERLFFQSRLPADLIKDAKNHIKTVEGGPIVVADLPEPKRLRLNRTPRAGVGRVGAGQGFDWDGGDDGREYIWADPDTGRVMNLEVLAAKGLFEHLQLANALQDNGWPPDDRGERDGKYHILCPFHSWTNDGGTYVWNASDRKKTGLDELKDEAGIHCLHDTCKNPRSDGQKRDRLEFILQLLREGGLTTANLEEALDAACAADLANDFEPIEDPDSIDLRPLIKPELTWTPDTIEANASGLRRLRKEDPDQYEQVRFAWDDANRYPADELDRLCDEAPDDISPEGEPAGMNMFDWRHLPDPFDPNQLPDRSWVLEGRLASGFVTAGFGAPGVGKSNFALLTAISIATGTPLTGETVVRQGRVLVHNNEDDFDEMYRRIAGICKHHDIDFDLVRKNLLLSSGEDRKLVLAVMKDRKVKPTSDVKGFIQGLKRHGITHVVLDPLVSLHNGIDENDNAAMESVLSIIRRIAKKADVSIDLIHHTVKDQDGNPEKRAGDQNAGRGASAIVGAVRFTYTLCRMSQKTAEKYKDKVPPELVGRYVRLDGAKANYAEDGATQWFKMRSVEVRDDPSELTPVISSTGEWIEDKGGPSWRRPLTVGVHELWDPTEPCQAVEAKAVAQVVVLKEDRKHAFLRFVAEAMPKDRCNVSDVLDAVKKQRGVQATAARSLVKKTVLDTDDGHVIQLGNRSCTLRIEREGHEKNGALWLVRDWLEPESDD